MVPSHSCHIYGIWTSRRSHHLGMAMQVTKGETLFIGKAGSHYVILLYCETLLQVLVGIYCKRFYLIPLFTMLLLFYMFEVGCNSEYPNDIVKILFYLWKFQTKQGFTPETPHNCVTPFINFKTNQARPLEIPRNFFLIAPRKFHIVFVSQE